MGVDGVWHNNKPHNFCTYPLSFSSSFFICCVYFHCKMELSSQSLWLRIVCPDISHTSVRLILICLERFTLKSKADGRSVGEGDEGNREIENRKHGIKWKQCTLVPVFHIYIFYITVFLSLLRSLFVLKLFRQSLGCHQGNWGIVDLCRGVQGVL